VPRTCKRIPDDEGIETGLRGSDGAITAGPANESPMTRGLKLRTMRPSRHDALACKRIPDDEGIETHQLATKVVGGKILQTNPR